VPYISHPERAEKILRQIKPEKIEFVLSEAKGLVDNDPSLI